MYTRNNVKHLCKKLIIITIGIVFILLLLEISLRIFGLFYHPDSVKSIENSRQGYTILALGDSYTYGIGSTEGMNYPFQLEKLLNKNSNSKFNVINVGLNGQNSSQVAEEIEDNISKFTPQLIVLLIGKNNYWNYYGYDKSFFNFINRIRVYKLIKLLAGNVKTHLSNNSDGNKILKFNAGEILKEKKSFDDIFKTHIRFSPKYNNYGVFLVRIHEFENAVNWFKASIATDSLNYYNYEGVAYALISEKKYNDAALFLKDAVRKNNNPDLYSLLGYIYSLMPDYDQAARWLKKGLEINSRKGILYYQLGKIYFLQDKNEESISILLKGIETEPYCIDYYDFLSFINKKSNNKDERINMAFKKDSISSGKLFSYNDTIDIKRFIYRLSTTSGETGNICEINGELDNNIEGISEWLKTDVLKIIEICKEKHVKLLIQNYPLNHIPPPDFSANTVLKDCALSDDVYFADNVKFFIGSGLPLNYFFVPDEHCNNKGYELMARNIFNKIISEKIIDIDTMKSVNQ
jgi:tetratricopeptide (TPR) repeat protein